MDDLDLARARFPVGSRLHARVSLVPAPGRIGIFLRADAAPEGFVDVLHLPRDVGAWPHVGQESEFEVLQHGRGQMRLWPLDPDWREPKQWVSDADWDAVTAALHVGDQLTGTITSVFTINRECAVDLGVATAVAEWSGTTPTVGEQRYFRITALLATTRRVLIAPA